MKKKPVPKGQHTVPRMHLQHFADPSPPHHVWTYSKADGRVWHAADDETGKQTHFYSAEREDGSFDTQLEVELGKVENAATPIYDRLIAGAPPKSADDRMHFAFFAGLLVTRTAAARRDAAEIIGRGAQITRYAYAVDDEAFASLVRKFEAERGETMPADIKAKVRQQMIDPSGFRVEVPKESTFAALKTSEKLAELFFRMSWTLLRPTHGFLITSDNPVARVVDAKSVSPAYGDGGFLNRTAQVSLALSPKCALLMTRNEGAPSQLDIGRKAVDDLNRVRAMQADEFLYAHLKHKDVRRLATDHKGSRPRLTTEGFGPKQFAAVTVPRKWGRKE